jgi:hypothetical protein
VKVDALPHLDAAALVERLRDRVLGWATTLLIERPLRPIP